MSVDLEAFRLMRREKGARSGRRRWRMRRCRFRLPTRVNAGKRWATDEPLRLGLQRIRDAVMPVLSGSGQRTIGASQAKAMAESIQPQVNFLFQNCKLDPAGDAALHVSFFLAVSTLLIFGAFAVHVLGGGAFEARTVGAMILRSSFWIAVVIVARRAMKQASAAGPAG